MEGLSGLSEIDLFLTLGTDPALLDLNGQNFIVKLGVLERVHANAIHSSSQSDNRATKRIRNN